MQSLILSRLPSAPHLRSIKDQELPSYGGCPRFRSPSPLPLLLPGSRSSSSLLSWARSSPSSPAAAFGRRKRKSAVSAAETISEGPAGEAFDAGALLRTAELAALFGLWYFFNIAVNIFTKQVLKALPHPLLLTTSYFAVGSALVLFMWGTNLYKKPNISSSQLWAVLPLAVVHTLGNVFTNMSIGKVAVAFTHIVKASEPFFSVVLSAIFLGQYPSLWVLLSLVPIVGGVAFASLTEASFNWTGFLCAMASNLANQSRNVFSKKFMIKKEETLDNITLFSVMTILSFLLLAPIALFVEGFKFNPSYIQSMGLNFYEVYEKALMAAFCFHAYQQVSYMILARVSPVTQSVGGCVKRVVVIVASVLFFKTPVSAVNSLGTGIALSGVFLYSRARRIKLKQT